MFVSAESYGVRFALFEGLIASQQLCVYKLEVCYPTAQGSRVRLLRGANLIPVSGLEKETQELLLIAVGNEGTATVSIGILSEVCFGSSYLKEEKQKLTDYDVSGLNS